MSCHHYNIVLVVVAVAVAVNIYRTDGNGTVGPIHQPNREAKHPANMMIQGRRRRTFIYDSFLKINVMYERRARQEK